MRRLQFEPRRLNLRQLLLQANWQTFQQSNLDWWLRQPPLERSRAPTRAPGPETPRAADIGTFLGAIWQLPTIQQAAGRAGDEATRRLNRLWNDSSTGERVLLVSHTISLAAPAMIAILENEDARTTMLEFLSGKSVPVPGVTGLSIELRYNTSGARPDYGAVITFDLMPYIGTDI